MNRKERRAAAKRGAIPQRADANAADLFAQAQQLYRQGASAQAEALCEQVLAQEPAHIGALNLAGLIAQAAGRHRTAVKMLGRAVAADPQDAACHYNLASSHQALGHAEEAAAHFRRAIALGLSGRNPEDFIVQSPVIGNMLARINQAWPAPVSDRDLFGADGLTALAADVFLRCALELVLFRTAPLEALLTQARAALLRMAKADDGLLAFACALAQQCFINEYVFAQGEEESEHAARLRDRLIDGDTDPFTLALAACYVPLHTLPVAAMLASRKWPEPAARLVRQQIAEPMEELRDRESIPALTPVETVSQDVRRQYEENPYPRWTVSSLAGERKPENSPREDILIAGCGTGKHPIEIAHFAPQSRILAVDISLSSLAYARRKTREAGISNIDYAQADVLKLGTLGRSFDVIECVGVLHHLADPLAGWRVLLPLLKPEGLMCIGLYSEAARRDVVEARAFVAQRGFKATPGDIRKCRAELLRGPDRRRFQSLTATADFHSMSGCRDLIFNVMEHRFTIPQIKAFLAEEKLEFLDFEVSPQIAQAFARKFPGAALTDLDKWHEFETANPMTFREMYHFRVRKS